MLDLLKITYFNVSLYNLFLLLTLGLFPSLMYFFYKHIVDFLIQFRIFYIAYFGNFGYKIF